MIIKVIIILTSIMLLSFNGCTSMTDDVYNTYPRGKINNSMIAKDSKEKSFFNGYIIGIEKRNIHEITDMSNNKNCLENKNAYSCIYNHVYNSDLNDNTYYKSKVNDPKAMLISHIFEVENKDHIAIYNPYKETNASKDIILNFNEGYRSLTTDFSKSLEKNLKKNNYSDIFVVSMGWHNDQNLSLIRINKLMSNLKRIKTNKDFKPLTIAITWPSSWASESESNFIEKLGHLFSYPNKTNDADELGFTLVNTLINEVIPNALEKLTDKKKPKVILVGHSLGARLLSRALFSPDYLPNNRHNKPKIDLFIGLQPAFSINRFNKNVINNPAYENVFRKLPIILTSSHKDTANKMAKYLGISNAGSGGGIKEAEKDKSIFCIDTWLPNEHTVMNGVCEKDFNNKVFILDVSAILDGSHNTAQDCKVDSHNDIFDMDMGYVIDYALREMIKGNK